MKYRLLAAVPVLVGLIVLARTGGADESVAPTMLCHDVYFSLKDQGARIDAVIWKGVFSRMRIKPEEGMEVIATGKVTTFPGKSAYQIIVEAMEPAGARALKLAGGVTASQSRVGSR